MCIGRVCIVRVVCVMAGLTGPVCIGRVCIVRVLCVMAGLTGPVKINMENAWGANRVKIKGDTLWYGFKHNTTSEIWIK